MIVADLYSLNVTKKDREHIEEAIEELEEINNNAYDREEAEENIEKIVEAVEEMEDVSVDISDIRLKLDELLKIWQKKWSLLPEEFEDEEDEEHSWFERYKLAYNNDPRESDRRLNPSFPQSVSGNPEKIKNKPILIASVGSLNGLFNSQTSIDILYFYHTDHLGTPIIMTDKDQNVVWEGEFMPFGETISITGHVTNNLRFPGQYYDSETGLHYNWHRDYKPKVGRYIEFDPSLRGIGKTGVDTCKLSLSTMPFQTPQELSPYVYVVNNSINLTDPLGLGKQYRCAMQKVLQCFPYCYANCEPNSKEEASCLSWCEGPGFVACGLSSKKEYPENPYCKEKKEQCEDLQ